MRDHRDLHLLTHPVPARRSSDFFIEVYLEDYHVGPFPPGLGQFVTCDDRSWEFSEQFSLQRVGVHNALSQPGTHTYKTWHDRLLDYRAGSEPDFEIGRAHV